MLRKFWFPVWLCMLATDGSSGATNDAILRAIHTADVDGLRQALRDYPDAVNGVIHISEVTVTTPLHRVAGTGHLPLVDVLLEAEAKVDVEGRRRRSTSKTA